MTHRVLVAGLGNIFHGDDGFGEAVVRRLRHDGGLPPEARLRDVGISGIHLLYELMDGYELLVLVDAAQRGMLPGTVSVLEPDGGGPLSGNRGVADNLDLGLEDGGSLSEAAVLDPHNLAPDRLLAAVADFGVAAERTLLVVCEPATLEPGIGLSEAVRDAVPAAARTVVEIVAEAVRDA